MTPFERADKIRQLVADHGGIVWEGINAGKIGANEHECPMTAPEEWALWIIGLRIGRAVKRGEI